MKTTISSEDQIASAAALREQDRIVPGQQFEIERLRVGESLLRKVAGPREPGLVEWLFNCPSQDWFQSIPSESTQDTPVVLTGDGPRRAKR